MEATLHTKKLSGSPYIQDGGKPVLVLNQSVIEAAEGVDIISSK